MTFTTPYFSQVPALFCWNTRRGAETRSRSACIGPTQEKTGDGFTLRDADRALMQRLGQGLRERDGQERAGRLTASLMGTWPVLHRRGVQVETGDFLSHPAEPMERATA